MRLYADSASGVLSVDAGANDTTLFLQSGLGALFPNPTAPDYAILTIEDATGQKEHCKLIGRLGDQLTVVRGQEGTAAKAFLAGSRVELRVTASALQSFVQRTEDSLDANTGSRLFFKRYLISGEGPGSADLYEGEFAINLADKWIWMGAPGAGPGNPVAPLVLSNGPNGASTIITTTTPQSYKVGQPLYFDGATLQLARADVLEHCATFIVKEVINDKRFLLTTNANVFPVVPADVGLSSIAAGQVYFLHPTVAGTYTSDHDAFAPGEYRQQVAIGVTTNTLLAVTGSPAKVEAHNDLLNRASASAHPASAIDSPSGGNLADWIISAAEAINAATAGVASNSATLANKYDKSGGDISGGVRINSNNGLRVEGTAPLGSPLVRFKGEAPLSQMFEIKPSSGNSEVTLHYGSIRITQDYSIPSYALDISYPYKTIPSVGAIRLTSGTELNVITHFRAGNGKVEAGGKLAVIPAEVNYASNSYTAELVASNVERNSSLFMQSLKPGTGGATGKTRIDMVFQGQAVLSKGTFRIENVWNDALADKSAVTFYHAGNPRLEFTGPPTTGKGTVRVGDLQAELGFGVYASSGLCQFVTRVGNDAASNDNPDSTDMLLTVQRRFSTDILESSFIVQARGACVNKLNVWGQISARSLKTDIADATPKLADIRRVRVRNFVMKSDAGRRKQIGVIAEELADVFPALVFDSPQDIDANGESVGKTKAVAYSVFVPILIKGLQEAADKIDTLEARIAALEEKLARMVN